MCRCLKREIQSKFLQTILPLKFKVNFITFDAIFNEIWLTLDKFDQCQFKGFIPIHLIRPSEDRPEFKTSGGGISIFIKPNIEFKQRNDLTVMLPFMESSFIEIKFNRQNYLIGGIYRVPDTNITEFIDHFNNIIEPIRTTHKVILHED